MKRLSPSMIVAIVALLVALGGGAIAATTLPTNSVGTRQIINHSIKRIDLGTPLPRGPRGRTGLQGAQGPTGPADFGSADWTRRGLGRQIVEACEAAA